MPLSMLQHAGRNDADAWAQLAMMEIRMLLARGQTHQARQFSDRLRSAAEAGMTVTSYERREIQQLINGIDAVQAGRHYLALHEIGQVSQSEDATIRWACELWRSRSLAAVGQLERAAECSARALEAAEFSDAQLLATCFDAELQARRGEVEQAELRVMRTMSQFIGQGETRGASLAHLSLAKIANRAGSDEESAAAADLAYKTDGSWTEPVTWLARTALKAGDVERAGSLLRSVPNPSTDAYNLLQALRLVSDSGVAVEAVLELIELDQLPPGDQLVQKLRLLLERHQGFTPARATLGWALLFLDRPEEARAELDELVQAEADTQTVAALRYGLQIYDDRNQPESLDSAELEEVVEFDADEATPVGPPGAPGQRGKVPAPPPAQPLMARSSGFTGQISLFGVPELVQFFSASRKTGIVEFSAQRGEAKIRLHQGELHWVESPSFPSVGQFLIDKELTSEEQLEALRRGKDTQVSRLVEEHELDPGKLREALQQLIHESLKELVDWQDGWFMFEVTRGTYEPRPDLLFSAQGVLLDVLREIDEANR